MSDSPADDGGTTEPAVTSGTTAPAADTTAEKTAGIVAIDATEHDEAKGVFQLIRDKVEQGVEDLESDFEKLKTLLHL